MSEWLCPSCKGAIGFDGSKEISGVRIPILRCRNTDDKCVLAENNTPIYLPENAATLAAGSRGGTIHLARKGES